MLSGGHTYAFVTDRAPAPVARASLRVSHSDDIDRVGKDDVADVGDGFDELPRRRRTN